MNGNQVKEMMYHHPLEKGGDSFERPLLLSCRSQEQAEIKFRDMSKTLVKR